MLRSYREGVEILGSGRGSVGYALRKWGSELLFLRWRPHSPGFGLAVRAGWLGKKGDLVFIGGSRFGSRVLVRVGAELRN